MDTESQILGALNEQQHLLQQLVWIGITIALAALARLAIAIAVTRRQFRQEGFTALATPLYMERRYDDILAMCRKRLVSTPSDPSPHWFMGLVHFDQGRLQEATPHFERALELAPTWGPQVRAYLRRIRDATDAKQIAGADA
jgi:Flp pilus assembly protein TadD